MMTGCSQECLCHTQIHTFIGLFSVVSKEKFILSVPPTVVATPPEGHIRVKVNLDFINLSVDLCIIDILV